MVKITGVEQGSVAEKAGICGGDYLIKINGCDINDVLDYRFYITENKITLTLHREAELFDITVKKNKDVPQASMEVMINNQNDDRMGSYLSGYMDLSRK